MNDHDDERFELIQGRLVEKPSPSAEHAGAQLSAGVTLAEFFQRGRSGGPGGWWFFTDDVQLGADVLRPDVCGYRKDRGIKRPTGRPVAIRPDWVCEILSVSNESRDRVEKQEIYFRANVPHYWLIDPLEDTLEVYRRTDLAFALVLAAHKGQRVRAEPFDAVELNVDELLGIDPTDDQ